MPYCFNSYNVQNVQHNDLCASEGQPNKEVTIVDKQCKIAKIDVWIYVDEIYTVLVKTIFKIFFNSYYFSLNKTIKN